MPSFHFSQRLLKMMMALPVFPVLVLYSCGGGGGDAPAPVEPWSISTVDEIGIPYGKTSLALDSDGKAHISYVSGIGASGEFRYATNASGTWNTTIIDMASGNSSIAVDSEDKVHVGYRSSTSGILMYATNVSGSWVVNAVDGATGNTVSLALDSSDNAHIGYDAGSDIKYATRDGSGTWTISTVETNVNNWFDISIALDSGGNIHMSYDVTGFSNDGLYYTTNKSGVWNTTIIDGALVFGYLSGLTSVAVDSGDNVHIVYNDTGPGQIKYATNETGVWVLQDIPGAKGQDPSMALDAGGNAHVGYYGCVPGIEECALKYATNASGSWVIRNVDGPQSGGARSSIAVDSSGGVHISYHSYDYATGELRYATNQ